MLDINVYYRVILLIKYPIISKGIQGHRRSYFCLRSFDLIKTLAYVVMNNFYPCFYNGSIPNLTLYEKKDFLFFQKIREIIAIKVKIYNIIMYVIITNNLFKTRMNILVQNLFEYDIYFKSLPIYTFFPINKNA